MKTRQLDGFITKFDFQFKKEYNIKLLQDCLIVGLSLQFMSAYL